MLLAVTTQVRSKILGDQPEDVRSLGGGGCQWEEAAADD
jgi:hypothetical protein